MYISHIFFRSVPILPYVQMQNTSMHPELDAQRPQGPGIMCLVKEASGSVVCSVCVTERDVAYTYPMIFSYEDSEEVQL